MKDGRRPGRGTERNGFWKNEAASTQRTTFESIEAHKSRHSDARISPELRDYRIKRGRRIQDGFESMELSIEPLSRAEGCLQFVPRWPVEHARTDA